MYVPEHHQDLVYKFTPNSIVGVSVAGTGSAGASPSELDYPTATAVDGNLNIYVLDGDNERVVVWAPNGTVGTVLIDSGFLTKMYGLLLVSGTPSQAYFTSEDNSAVYLWTFNSSTPDLNLTQIISGSSTLSSPRGLTFDTFNNLYVADKANNRIVVFCANSTVGIPIIPSTPAEPVSIAFDSNLNMYIAAAGAHEVVKYTLM